LNPINFIYGSLGAYHAIKDGETIREVDIVHEIGKQAKEERSWSQKTWVHSQPYYFVAVCLIARLLAT
jgi:hypothetical protein